MTTTTQPSSRGARHLANTRREAIHAQQRQALAAAHRTLDRFKAEQDRLHTLGWHSRPEGRAGQLVALIRNATQRIVDLEAQVRTEAALGLEPEPAPAPVVANGSRTGLPPTWWLGDWPQARQPAPRSRAAAVKPHVRARVKRPIRSR